MSTRTKELLALSVLACWMIAWIVGAAIRLFSRLDRGANFGGDEALYTLPMLGLIGCASLAILIVIAHFIRAILRET